MKHLLLEEFQKRPFRRMKFRAAVSHELFRRREIMPDGCAFLEALDHSGTNVRAAAHRGGVSQSLRRRLNRRHDLSLPRRRLLRLVGTGIRQRAGAHDGSCPGAKIFRAERLAHYFLNILVDMSALNVNKLSVFRLIVEYFCLAALEQRLEDSGNLAISQLSILAHA